MINKFYEAHKSYLTEANLFTFPVKSDKTPINMGWQKLRDSKEISAMDWSKAEGIGIPAEANTLEIIDIDSDNAPDPIKFRQSVLMALKHTSDRFGELPIIQTRSGGCHIYYHVAEGHGNTKLARDKKGVTLIETRGFGGYVVAPPSDGYDILQGDLTDIPELDAEERDLLIDICEDFNEYVPTQRLMKMPKRDEAQESSVFTNYNLEANLVEILEGYGYTYVDATDKGHRLLRPNGTSKYSVIVFTNSNLVYVHSTSCAPLESDNWYTATDLHILLSSQPKTVVYARIMGKMRIPEHLKEEAMSTSVVRMSNVTILSKDVDQKAKYPTDGAIINDLFNEWGLEFRTNTLSNNVEVLDILTKKWMPLMPEDLNVMWLAMSPKYKVTVADIKTTIYNPFVAPSIDPIGEFWENQPAWDGIDRIPSLLDELNPVNRGAAELYLRRWMYGMYMNSLGKGHTNEIILTLVGGQGTGKDRFIETLLPRGLESYFATSNMSGSDRDAYAIMKGNLIVNISEGDVVVNTKKSVEWLKGIVSASKLTQRRLHTSVLLTEERRCSFTMTSNERGMLNDETGNRRIAIIESTGINYMHTVDVNQVYAQIRSQEEKWWFSQEEIAQMSDDSEDYRQVSAEEEMVLKYFEVADDSTYSPVKEYTSSEICDWLSWATQLRYDFRRLGRVLSKVFDKQKFKSGSRRGYRVQLTRNGIGLVAGTRGTTGGH